MRLVVLRLFALTLLAGPCMAVAAVAASAGHAAPGVEPASTVLVASTASTPQPPLAPGEPINAASAAPMPPAATVTAAAPGAIPFRRDSASGAGSLAGSAWGVLVVSLLAIGAVLYVRKRLNLNPLNPRQGAAPRLLRVLETQRLGPRALLSVVEFGGQQHLIAQSEHGVSHLVTAPAAGAAGATPFGQAVPAFGQAVPAFGAPTGEQG